MLSEGLLRQLEQLSLAMRGRAQGGAGGNRRSRQTGSSAEFSDYREYVPGDDIRRLDWNALARFDRLYLKLFMEEQESAVHVLLDGSASMQAKWNLARDTAEALGFLALISGDRLKVHVLRGQKSACSGTLAGRAAYSGLTAFLESQQPDGAVNPEQAVHQVTGLKKGLTVLITDGYGENGLGRTLDYLRYQRQECAVIQVLSPEELRPDLEGAVRLTDSETRETVDVVADREALARYHRTLETFLRETREACYSREASWVLLTEERPLEETLIPLLTGSGMAL